VIFPIIGHSVSFPNNPDLRKIIEDIMKEDDITIAKFISQSQLVTTSAAGSYRKIVARGEDISFDIVEV
jgi:tRNA(Glu) U13 pseudouridine synthase TruD